MAGKHGSIDEVQRYLRSSCRAMETDTRNAVHGIFEKLKSFEDISTESGCAVEVIGETSCYVFFQSTETSGAQYNFIYDKAMGGLRLEYAPAGKSNLAIKFVTDYADMNGSESSEKMIGEMVSGMDKVIAFQSGKAYALNMKEIGEFTPKEYIEEHVHAKQESIQRTYSSTIASLQRNNTEEKRKLGEEIEEWKRQSFGDLSVDWNKILEGKYQISKRSGDVCFFTHVKPIITEVQTRESRDRFFLKTPYEMAECLVLKRKGGSWRVFKKNYAHGTYEHPHVDDGGDLCLGNMGHLSSPLKTAAQFLDEIAQIKRVLSVVNWDSPYTTEFEGPDAEMMVKLKNFDNAWREYNLGNSRPILSEYGLIESAPEDKGIITID